MSILIYLLVGFALSLYLCDGISDSKMDHVIISLVYPVFFVTMLVSLLNFRRR